LRRAGVRGKTSRKVESTRSKRISSKHRGEESATKAPDNSFDEEGTEKREGRRSFTPIKLGIHHAQNRGQREGVGRNRGDVQYTKEERTRSDQSIGE